MYNNRISWERQNKYKMQGNKNNKIFLEKSEKCMIVSPQLQVLEICQPHVWVDKHGKYLILHLIFTL